MAHSIRFTPSTSWIWSEQANHPRNNFVCFRRVFRLVGSAADATLRLTADSRYELYVNGHWLGHGPVRSWLSPWPVDEYDLQPYLKPGKNVIAVVVQHIGTGTFQYIPAEPGLLGEMVWSDKSGEHRIVTDRGWRCRQYEAYEWNVPRISCQQAWEEQFDARRDFRNAAGRSWKCADYNGAGWSAAKEMQPAGQGAHRQFERRDIPMLTRERMEPTRVVSFDAVLPARYSLSINPRRFFNPHDLSSNMFAGRMILATHIHSEQPQTVQFYDLSGCLQGHELKLNGRRLVFDDHGLQATDGGVARSRLKKGWNTLLSRMSLVTHSMEVVMNVWTDRAIRFSAWGNGVAGGADSPWLILGPFDGPIPKSWHVAEDCYIGPAKDQLCDEATEQRFEAIWTRGRLTDKDLAAPFARPATDDMLPDTNVFALCASERKVPNARVRIDEPAALQRDNSDWTTIHPVKGADVRVLLDFGRGVIGYHEIEIDAPEAAIIDNHNFEFIQHDGRFNLAEGMNNSFRYVCREGVQRYRTFVRRGFRYSWLSFRNFDRPVKVRFVRLIMSTYPTAQRGDFACNDPMLTNIWHVGAHSIRCCSEDTYTDCPSYEQAHWVGDARNEAMVDLVANGDPRLSWHCWLQAGRSLSRSPLVESQVPSAWRNILPAWSFLWMRWAHEHYVLTGDKVKARRMIGFLQRNIRGIERHINKSGLFEIGAWNMFDWAPMDTEADVVTHQNCLAVLGLRQAAELARLIGQPAKARQWNKLADELSLAINRRLWCARKRAYFDCIHDDGKPSSVFSQQTQTAAYISGVASGRRAKRCREIIDKAPRGFVTAGSPFFMFFLLEALVNEGEFTHMVKTIRDYWGRQIEQGATTFWEMYYPDEERHTRSHCHGWSAAPTFFLSQHVLGIQPLEPGYAKALISPKPAGLKWAHGIVPTPHGDIEVYWKDSRRCFEFSLSMPAGLPARIELPASGNLCVDEGRAGTIRTSRQSILLSTVSPKLKLTVQRR